MADKELGDLTDAGALDGTELAYVVTSGGNSRKTTVARLRTPNIRTVTGAGDITVAATDDIILVNKASGEATNVTLPEASSRNGRPLTIKDLKGDAASNNITPVADGSETIEGVAASNFVIATNRGFLRLLPVSGGWIEI